MYKLLYTDREGPLVHTTYKTGLCDPQCKMGWTNVNGSNSVILNTRVNSFALSKWFLFLFVLEFLLPLQFRFI